MLRILKKLVEKFNGNPTPIIMHALTNRIEDLCQKFFIYIILL